MVHYLVQAGMSLSNQIAKDNEQSSQQIKATDDRPFEFDSTFIRLPPPPDPREFHHRGMNTEQAQSSPVECHSACSVVVRNICLFIIPRDALSEVTLQCEVNTKTYKMLADGEIVGDGSWNLTIYVTDMNEKRTMVVKGDMHIGGVMLKLTESFGKLS